METTPQVTAVSETTYEELLDRLEYLAGLWRRSKDNNVVQRYHAVLLTLLELGYRDWLDLEILLPEELMPSQYATLMQTSSKQRKDTSAL